MKIKEEHKILLKNMGLKEEDFRLFDGEWVRYEFDVERGIRIYDPCYRTSYNEYIDVDGWSSWSAEGDTFMSDMLEGAKRKVEESVNRNPKPADEEIAQSIKKKFGKKVTADS